MKITFAAWVRTNNEFQIIIVGHGDSHLDCLGVSIKELSSP